MAQIHTENGGDIILVGRNQTKLDAQKKQLMDQYKENFQKKIPHFKSS